jgi:hypothetical protein
LKVTDRQTRVRHVGEQYWRSLRVWLRRNQRPQFGAGHFAQWMMPTTSRANCCRMASISSVDQ